MTLGPVQLLAIGYGTDAQFTGGGARELKQLHASTIRRSIDLLSCTKTRTAP